MDTVVDLASRQDGGELTYAFCRKYLDEIVTVTELRSCPPCSLSSKSTKLSSPRAYALLLAVAKLSLMGKRPPPSSRGQHRHLHHLRPHQQGAHRPRASSLLRRTAFPDKPAPPASTAGSISPAPHPPHHNQAMVTDSLKVQLTATCENLPDEDHICCIIAALQKAAFADRTAIEGRALAHPPHQCRLSPNTTWYRCASGRLLTSRGALSALQRTPPHGTRGE